MGLSEVSLCWCQGEVCEAGSGQGRILRWWRQFKGFSDLLFWLGVHQIWRRVVLRLDAPGLFLPVSLSTGVDQRSSAQSPLLVIAGGFFLCSQRQTRGSSVSLGARWYLFLLVVSLGVPGGVCGYPAFWRVGFYADYLL